MSKKSTNKEQVVRDKIQDISKLKEMLNAIQACEDGQQNLKETFIKIGDLAGGTNRILFNDKNDGDSYYVRNKYGYIQRNKANKINPSGIYFEKLYQLKIILENKSFTLPTSTFDLELTTLSSDEDFYQNEQVLKQDLSLLKQKIINILNQEKTFIETNNIFSYVPQQDTEDADLKLDNIIDFANEHYEQIIFKKIKCELDNVTEINLNIREDIYYFARKFTIIGELLHELLEGRDKTDDLSPVLTKLIDMRNIFVHSNKLYLTSNSVDLTAQNATDLVKILNIIISEQDKKFIFKKDDQDTIILLENNLEKIGELFSTNNKKKSASPLSTVVSVKTDQDKNINEAKKLIVGAAGFITQLDQETIADNDIKKENILTQLEKKNKEYLDILKKIDITQLENYPAALNLYEKIKILNIAETIKAAGREKQKSQVNLTKKSKTILKQITKIDREIIYLKEVEQNIEIDQLKKEYIIQHIATIIGDAMSVIGECDTSKSIPNISSTVAHEAFISGRTARVEGLAHNIFSFNPKKLAERIKNDILPAHEHFKSIFTIYEHNQKKTTITTITLNQIGTAFLKLGQYDQAINYFNQAKEHIKNNPTEIYRIKISQTEILDEQENVKLIDFDKELFGVEYYDFMAHRNLATAYLLNENYEEAYKLLITITNEINYSNLEFASKDFIEYIAEISSHTACCLAFQEDYEEARELYERANQILQNDIIKINLTYVYRRLNQTDKANEILKDIIKTSDVVTKFHALDYYIHLLSEGSDREQVIADATKYILELEDLLKNNIHEFKEKKSDQYFLVLLVPLKLRVNIIAEKAQLTHQQKGSCSFPELESELARLEVRFNDTFKKITHNLRKNQILADTYRAFCDCFSSLIIPSVCDSNKEKNKLDKAQSYFDLLKEINIFSDKEVADTANILAVGYSNYAMNKPPALGIDYLIKALDLQDKYNMPSNITLSNLGFAHHNLGDHYLNGIEDCNKSLDNAYINFDKAIYYLTQAMRNINSNLTKENLAEILKTLAASHESIGLLRFNIESLNEAIKYYQEAIKLNINQEEIRELRDDCYHVIHNVQKIFLDICYSLNDIKVPLPYGFGIKVSEIESYSLSFYKEQLPVSHIVIEENTLKIYLKDSAAVTELKNFVKQELDYISRVIESDKDFLNSINSKIFSLYEKGTAAYNSKEYDEAIEKYTSAIELVTQILEYSKRAQDYNVTLHFNIARAYHNKGDLQQALIYYDKTLGFNKDHSKSREYISACKREIEHYNHNQDQVETGDDQVPVIAVNDNEHVTE